MYDKTGLTRKQIQALQCHIFQIFLGFVRVSYDLVLLSRKRRGISNNYIDQTCNGEGALGRRGKRRPDSHVIEKEQYLEIISLS